MVKNHYVGVVRMQQAHCAVNGLSGLNAMIGWSSGTGIDFALSLVAGISAIGFACQ